MTISEEQIREIILKYIQQNVERPKVEGDIGGQSTDSSFYVIMNAIEERRVSLLKKSRDIDAELTEIDFLREGGLEEIQRRVEEDREKYRIAEEKLEEVHNLVVAKELKEKDTWRPSKTRGQTKII